VVESEDAVRERGMRAICEVLATNIANSAYHGTRLNVNHVSQVMETLLKTAEARYDIARSQIARRNHVRLARNLYPGAARGSAAAEIHALRERLRRTGQPGHHCQHQGFHRPYHGRRNRRCGGSEGA